jgi:translation initiation factor IF-2
MQLPHMALFILIVLEVGGATSLVSAQPSQTLPGPSVPGTANPNNAVGPQGISPPVSGSFGVTQSPGTAVTPGYSPGAKPPGVGSGAGPGLSSGAPFSGTGYGTNSLGRTSPDAGASVPSTPSIGTQRGAMGPGGRSTNSSSLGSGPGAGSPGPSMGSTPSSGAMAPGAGAGAGGGR